MGIYKKNEAVVGTIIRYLDTGVSKFVILDFGTNFHMLNALIQERMIKSQQVIKSDKATILISIQVKKDENRNRSISEVFLKTQDEKSNEILENVKITGEFSIHQEV